MSSRVDAAKAFWLRADRRVALTLGVQIEIDGSMAAILRNGASLAPLKNHTGRTIYALALKTFVLGTC